MLEKKVYMKIEMGDYRSIFVSKSLSVDKNEFCECVEIFQHYMDEVVYKVGILAHFGIWLNFPHFQNRQK